MQMYQLREKADQIFKLIEVTKEKHFDTRPEKEAIQADNNWGAARLLATLFYAGDFLPDTYIMVGDIERYLAAFEAANGPFDYDALLDKCWIRIIGDMPEVATAVADGAKQYQKVKEAEAEFDFLILAVEKFKTDKPITKDLYVDYLQQYQKDKGIELDLAKCKAFNWLYDKDDKIKASGLEYYKPLFKYKKELEFVSFLMEKKTLGSKYRLVLGRDQLEKICGTHKNFYPATPSIDDFISQELIIREGDIYFLNLWNCQPDYWVALHNKIGLLLFRQMKDSAQYVLHGELFKTWILKMNLVNVLIESPELMTIDEVEMILNYSCETLLNENDLIGSGKEADRLLLSKHQSKFVILVNAENIGFPDLNAAKNIFELFNLMEDCNDLHQSDLLWLQEIRYLMIPNLVKESKVFPLSGNCCTKA